MTFWLDSWLLVFWIVVLAGLVGGKVFLQPARWQRRWHLLVLVYLLALLAVLALPEIAPGREISREVRSAAELGLPLLFVPLALIPAERESEEVPQVIDFFYSVFLMLALGTIVLGSFALMTLRRLAYLEALTATVFAVAGTILLLAFVWTPRAGSGGFALIFSRHLFSIGVPIERWLHFLSELSRVEERPGAIFSPKRCRALRAYRGSQARAGRRAVSGGEAGEASEHRLDYADAHLALALLFALPRRAGARLASAASRAAALGVLPGEAARAGAARGKLPAGGARDRRAPCARRQKPAAIARHPVRDGASARRRSFSRSSAGSFRDRQRLAATLDKLRAPARDDGSAIDARERRRRSNAATTHRTSRSTPERSRPTRACRRRSSTVPRKISSAMRSPSAHANRALAIVSLFCGRPRAARAVPATDAIARWRWRKPSFARRSLRPPGSASGCIRLQSSPERTGIARRFHGARRSADSGFVR
ncbi:MAG: hypothetical protein RML56_01315 [Burkholderiales bacterium]|nr:hypothetical protein [Burkholderiales bacterium]